MKVCVRKNEGNNYVTKFQWVSIDNNRQVTDLLKNHIGCGHSQDCTNMLLVTLLAGNVHKLLQSLFSTGLLFGGQQQEVTQHLVADHLLPWLWVELLLVNGGTDTHT